MSNDTSSQSSPAEFADLMQYGSKALTDFASMDFSQDAALAGLAQQILNDPIALEKLSDRIYERLQQEIRLQQERRQAYRRTRL